MYLIYYIEMYYIWIKELSDYSINYALVNESASSSL